jgi:4-hydroxy-tetrahydrodipicolinate reductase
MKIAIIGYGKMGKVIEDVARHRGHEICLIIDRKDHPDFSPGKMACADVAIEFTNPASAGGNVRSCLEWGIPVVCGTTGWSEELEVIRKFCIDKNGTLLYATNFSVGVNLFFELNKRLAELMAGQPDYEVILEETHHTHKKDAPSGTAITLAEQILKSIERKKQWVNDLSENPEDLEIISQRVDPAPGTHSVKYASAIDNIEIIHTAHNRKGFAHGAVLAAEFLKGTKGFFTMKDVLNL